MKKSRNGSVEIFFIMAIIFFISSSDYDFPHNSCKVMNKLFYLGTCPRKKSEMDEMLRK